MAQGFDSNKATNDLKQLLNLDAIKMNSEAQSMTGNDSTAADVTAPGSKKKMRKRLKNAGDKKEKKSEECETPASLNVETKASTNSNGNALSSVTNSADKESSVPVMNSKDSKPSAKSKSKKKKNIKEQLNSSDNANSHRTADELTSMHAQDKITTVSNPQTRTTSARSSSASSHKSITSSNEKKAENLIDKGTKEKDNLKQEDKGKNMANTNTVVASNVKLGEEDLSPEFLARLEPHKIHILKKRNTRFPKAKFFCRLCDYHLDRKEDCEKHIQDNRHCRRKEVHEMDSVLRQLPPPSPKQISAVTESLDQIDLEYGISEEEKEERLNIVQRLEKTIKEKIPDVILFMYGTSLTRMGLKSGDINVDLNSSNSKKALTLLLKEVHEVMKDRTDTGFSNVHSDFSATVPALLLTDTKTDLTVTMTIYCYSAHCSSELLAIYSAFDDRVRKLAVAFRYWANVCGLDRHSDGFMPPVALNIMVIYALQSMMPPVVPFILPPKVGAEERGDFHKDAPSFTKLKKKALENSDKSKDTRTIGDLWLNILKFYSVEFDTPNVVVCIRAPTKVPRTTKPWNSKKLAVEDPFMTKKNVTRMFNNSRIYEFWQDSIRKAYHYFGLPRDKKGASLILDQEINTLSKSQQQSANPSSIDNLKKSDKDGVVPNSNATKSQDSQNRVVIPSHPLLRTSSESTSSTDSLCSTPDSPDRASNVHVLKRNSVLETVKRNSISQKEIGDSNSIACSGEDVCALTTGVKELNLQTDSSNPEKLKEDISLPTGQNSEGQNKPVLSEEKVSHAKVDEGNSEISDIKVNQKDNVSSGIKISKTDSESVDTKVSEKDNESVDTTVRKKDNESSGNKVDKKENEVSSKQPDQDKDNLTLRDQQECDKKDATVSLPPCLPLISITNCYYEFTKDSLTDGKGPTLVCSTCEKEGHLKNSCPEDELPPILPLPPMTEYHHKMLKETIQRVPDDVGLSRNSFHDRQSFIQHLQMFINYHFPDALLCLFGSSCNGFGFAHSDMDICMTFSRRRDANVDKVYMIEKLARYLRHCDELQAVQAISTAKVPIVKFFVRRLNLEGDISLYNTLAQENTRLLKCYSEIDPRVKTLGYTIKTFAKVCDIGDASRGSLSSYAYILMMLYYLQQVKPAVIPVLQELYEGDKKPVTMVEDCDAWFMDNRAFLPKLWPEMGKNKMSVAELWLGFLRFYVEEFNYKEFVVCIRQKEMLTKFEKLWNGSSIAIEDPFDLNHNLGSGLTRTMNNFIFKTFINGRMLYGSPIDDNMEMFKKYQNASDYFFDTELLSESRPPNVRGCRRCGKIGHMVRHCPHNKKDKDEEQKKHQTKQQDHHPQQQQQQSHPKSQQSITQHGDNHQSQQQQRQPHSQPSKPPQTRQQHQQQQQQQQQRPYMPSPKNAHQPPRPQAHHQHNGRERYYGHNSNNNANSTRGPQQLDSLSSFNEPGRVVAAVPAPIAMPALHLAGSKLGIPFLASYYNNAPGYGSNTTRGINAGPNPQMPPPPPGFQRLNHFAGPQGPPSSHPGNLPSLPPSLMSSTPRTSMPSGQYGSFTEPPHGASNYRMPPPPNFYNEASRSAPPPNFGGGSPFNMPPSLNPVVQSLFASTQGKVMDVGSMVPQNHKKK